MTTTQTPSRSNGTHWVNGVCSYGHDITDPRNLRTRRDRTHSRECRQCHNDRRRERAAKAPGTKPCLYCGHRYDAGRPGTRGYERRRYCSAHCRDAALKNAPRVHGNHRLPIDAPVTDPNWRNRAACRDEDPEVFFADSQSAADRRTRDAARAICRRCPVTADCLRWALAADAYGIWGGTTWEQRTTKAAP